LSNFLCDSKTFLSSRLCNWLVVGIYQQTAVCLINFRFISESFIFTYQIVKLQNSKDNPLMFMPCLEFKLKASSCFLLASCLNSSAT